MIDQNIIINTCYQTQNTIQTIAISYEDPESVFKYYRDPEKLKAIELYLAYCKSL